MWGRNQNLVIPGAAFFEIVPEPVSFNAFCKAFWNLRNLNGSVGSSKVCTPSKEPILLDIH